MNMAEGMDGGRYGWWMMVEGTDGGGRYGWWKVWMMVKGMDGG